WGQERGGPLTRDDIEAVVAYIRTWQRVPRAPLDERAPGGVAANASATFARECERCHGARGTGGPNIHIGNVDLLSAVSNGFLRYAIANGRQGTAMPAF